jgi:hypothetical protein
LNIRSKFDEICDFLRSFVQELRLLHDLTASDPKFPEIFFQIFAAFVEGAAVGNFIKSWELALLVLGHTESKFAPGILMLLAAILHRFGVQVDLPVVTRICDTAKLGLHARDNSFDQSLQVFRELLIFDDTSIHFQALFDGLLRSTSALLSLQIRVLWFIVRMGFPSFCWTYPLTKL